MIGINTPEEERQVMLNGQLRSSLVNGTRLWLTK